MRLQQKSRMLETLTRIIQKNICQKICFYLEKCRIGNWLFFVEQEVKPLNDLRLLRSDPLHYNFS